MNIYFNNSRLAKFNLDKKKITVTITIEDLVKYFNNCPANYDYDHEIAKVIPGKELKFALYVLQKLMDDAPYEADDYVWSQPLTYVFEQLLEDYRPDFLDYTEEV